MKRIAILLTCFNRKEMTLRCLDSLLVAKKHYEETSRETLSCEVFLVDDGSTDGTGAEVNKRFPSVHVIQGSGSLYWARGMRLSWAKALEHSRQWDYFFLVNDDVLFHDTAFHTLFKTSVYTDKPAIVSGLVCDIEDHTKVTYGGEVWQNRFRGTTKRLGYSETPQLCDMANANALLIPFEVFSRLGGFDTKYTHGCADYDYTIIARKKGVGVYLTPIAVGVCRNDHKNNDSVLKKMTEVSLKERIAYYRHPLHSSKDYMHLVLKVMPARYPQVLFGRFMAIFFPQKYYNLNKKRLSDK